MTHFRKNIFKPFIVVFLFCILFTSFGSAEVNAAGKLKITAEFENDRLHIGKNKVTINAENNNNEPMPLTIILAIYTGNKMKNISVIDKGRIPPLSVVAYNEYIEPDSTVNIENSVLTVYFFEDINNIQPISKKITNIPKGFTFNLEKDCTVSAGVYTGDDVLIKTLWGGKKYTAGTHYGFWDGTNDEDQIVKNGNYKIKILTNNVQFKHDGLIGNNMTFPDKDRNMTGYGFYGGMALAGTKMYTTSQYSEGDFGLQYFDIVNPHFREGYLGIRNMQANKVATDGQRVYWGSQEHTYYSTGEFAGKHVMTGFIHATNVSDNSKHVFSKGTTLNSIWLADNMYSATNIATGYTLSPSDTQDLLKYDSDDSRIGGIAVQKNGRFLFSTYPNINKVYIADKITGEAAPVSTVTLTTPLGITVDTYDNVWISYVDNGKNVVGCFTVSTGGALNANFILPTEFIKPLAVAVSPDGQTVVVADGGEVNKVYAFNTWDGSPKWSFGSGESYRTDPTVKDDKLLFRQFFRSIEWIEYSFLTFEDDNTLWVGDVGNFRARKLHIGSDCPVITDTLSYLQNSYSCNVNLAKPTMVFSDALEFEVDYSKDINTAWKLKNNWTLYIENRGKIKNMGIFKNITTLKNNRTYFIISFIDIVNNRQIKRDRLFELEKKTIRDTGIDMGNGCILRADGSLSKIDRSKSPYRWIKRELVGFDDNNNPTWGEDKVLAEIPYDATEPFFNNSLNHTFAITSSNILISHREYANFQSDIEKTDMRLGGIKLSDTTATSWAWKANPTTSRNYYRDFPTDGYYDIGNGVWSTSSTALTLGRNVIHQYYGEGYRGAQVDKFTHFYDNGLLVGVYGGIGQSHSGEMIPGNGFSWNLVQDPTNADAAYIYQNDEARCGGVHRSKLTGLSTIKEQEINIMFENQLAQGVLQYELFGTENFDSACLVKKGTVNNFELSSIANNAENSVRYTGFIKFDASMQYTFVTRTSGYVNVWLDNKLIIDGTSIKSSAPIQLEEGILYPIKIEMSKNNGNWSNLEFALSRITNSIPFTMFSSYDTAGNSNSINLMEGVPFGTTLQDDTPRSGIENMPYYITAGQYGWTFSPPLNHTQNSMKLWTVKTNGTSYDRSDDNDIIVTSRSYGKNHAEYTLPRFVTRNLRNTTGEGIKAWSVEANITISDWLNNGVNGELDGNFGQYIDVLDINDKVIARFYIVCIMSGNTAVRYEVYGNRGLIYQTTNVEGRYIAKYSKHEFNIPSVLKISSNGTDVIFEYRGGKVSAPIFETDAIITQPKTFRVMHFNEKRDFNNIGVNTNIINLKFIPQER